VSFHNTWAFYLHDKNKTVAEKAPMKRDMRCFENGELPIACVGSKNGQNKDFENGELGSSKGQR